MNNIERRNEPRIDVQCEIFCKLQGSNKLYEALCVTLSSTGVSLVCQCPFEVASVVEVSIIQETAMPVLDFLITVVRCRVLEDGDFDIGAIIRLPEESD
jgi:hypothetical protein